MKTLFWIAGIVLVALAWVVVFPRYWIPFKVKAVVDTPEGERSGNRSSQGQPPGTTAPSGAP